MSEKVRSPRLPLGRIASRGDVLSDLDFWERRKKSKLEGDQRDLRMVLQGGGEGRKTKERINVKRETKQEK